MVSGHKVCFSDKLHSFSLRGKINPFSSLKFKGQTCIVILCLSFADYWTD